nr:hypothetical protein CFP56_00848 [Quercus suber]
MMRQMEAAAVSNVPLLEAAPRDWPLPLRQNTLPLPGTTLGMARQDGMVSGRVTVRERGDWDDLFSQARKQSVIQLSSGDSTPPKRRLSSATI